MHWISLAALNVALCADSLSIMSKKSAFWSMPSSFSWAMAVHKVDGATTAPSSSVEDEPVT